MNELMRFFKNFVRIEYKDNFRKYLYFYNEMYFIYGIRSGDLGSFLEYDIKKHMKYG